MIRLPSAIKSQIIFGIICGSLFLLTSCSSKSGCTDAAANNFESNAKFDDSTCTYPIFTMKPDSFVTLKTKFNENSGLLWCNNRIWTFADGGGETTILSVDTTDGGEYQNIFLNNTVNTDWEDLAQDNQSIYVGNFGNNSGNRTDLSIYKFNKYPDSIGKSDKKANVDEITFRYPDQTDFRKDESSNFDCEAMIAQGNFIYLFTKCHKDNRTRLYRLPNTPGDYQAELIGLFYTHGVSTGADISPDGKAIALTGYNPNDNKVYLYIFRDFQGDSFFKGKKYKIDLGYRTTIGQVEGVCFRTNNQLYLSNENYQSIPPSIYKINIQDVR